MKNHRPDSLIVKLIDKIKRAPNQTHHLPVPMSVTVARATDVRKDPLDVAPRRALDAADTHHRGVRIGTGALETSADDLIKN